MKINFLISNCFKLKKVIFLLLFNTIILSNIVDCQELIIKLKANKDSLFSFEQMSFRITITNKTNETKILPEFYKCLGSTDFFCIYNNKVFNAIDNKRLHLIENCMFSIDAGESKVFNMNETVMDFYSLFFHADTVKNQKVKFFLKYSYIDEGKSKLYLSDTISFFIKTPKDNESALHKHLAELDGGQNYYFCYKSDDEVVREIIFIMTNYGYSETFSPYFIKYFREIYLATVLYENPNNSIGKWDEYIQNLEKIFSETKDIKYKRGIEQALIEARELRPRIVRKLNNGH